MKTEADVKTEADMKIRSSVQTRPAPALEDGQRGRVIITPHNPQARWATKQSHAWGGYKLHLTETAAEDAPLLITDLDIVATAAHDSQAVTSIQQRLQACDLLPDTHLADAGYVNGLTIQSSLGYGVNPLGPITADTLGASRKDTILPSEAFAINVENQQATCPGGHFARLWSLYQRSSRKGRSLVAIAGDKKTCSQCPLRSQRLPPGQLQRVLRLSPYYTLLTNRRAEQKTIALNHCLSRALPPAGGDRGDVFASGECSSNASDAVLRLGQDALPLRGSCCGGKSASGGAVGSWTASSTEAAFVSLPITGNSKS